MRLVSVYTLLLLASLLCGCLCVVWGPKESLSGVRGHGQRTPQVFEISPAGELIEDELQSIASHFTANNPSGLKRFKRQSSGSIGYTAGLVNDNHNQAVLHWTGYPSENIFIVTRKLNSNGHSDESWLWRSTDFGHTFLNDTGKLPSDSVVEWYKVSPFSEYLIFTDIKHNRVYVTEDEGERYTVVNTPFTPNTLLFQSILAPSSTDSPYNKYVLGYDSSAQTLWVSMDLGLNWTKIGDNVPSGRYYWRRLDSDVEGDLSTVYYEQKTSVNASMLYMWHSGMVEGGLGQVFSPELGEFRSMSFVLEHEYMFVQKPETTDVEAFLSPLWVSHNRNPTFVQASFPFVTEQQHYSVIDASEGQVFIAVYHIGNTSNLYISEEKGVIYSLTLEDIVSPPVQDWVNGNPSIDVHVVEGVVGTYFANRHSTGSRYGSTVVSFNKGGRWDLLTPPALDYNDHPVVCAPPDCSLHLHMDIDADYRNYQSILSQDSAIGLIMAQGNLGSTLSSSTWRTRLYFSRDGGFTRVEVRRGLYEFQFAALGSIVVAVQKRTSVSTVVWTCDEGATWQRSSFVDSDFPQGIVVVGMRTETGQKARRVTIFGYDRSGGRFSEWLVFTLNFTSVVPRQCDPDEDYYDWIPTDKRPGSRCLLGVVVAYERRNASECCYVDPNYEKGIERDTCVCAIEDFECDYGFERTNLNGPCNPYPGLIYPPDPPEECPENETYTFTSGYRKIAGDKCIPGTETYFFPITHPCPIKPPRFLVLSYSPGLVEAGDPVTFTLTQFEGAVIKTNYTWNFNDFTDPVTVLGLANARQQTHTFIQPGVYDVTLTAVNEAGASEVVQTVRVLDAVASVYIVSPPQTFNSQVPTSISLLFTALVIAQYNHTDLLDIRSYSWDFGDTSFVSSNGPTVSHTYSTPGTYTVTLIAHAPFVSWNNEDSLMLIVYEAVSVVDVISNSSALVTTGGTTYIPVNSQVTFFPQPQQSRVQLPPDAVNMWRVVKISPVGDDGINRTVTTLVYSFTSWGVYHISVIGHSSHSGASFVGQRYITAENRIANAEIQHVPTARPGSIITVEFTVTDSTSSSYEGPLTLSILVNDTVVVSSTSFSTPGQVSTLSLEVSGRGDVEYKFKANNDLSSFMGRTTINIIVECPNVRVNEHIQTSGGGVGVGSVITFSCQHGYDLNGSSNLRCLSSGQWDYDFPTCVKGSGTLPPTTLTHGTTAPPVLSHMTDTTSPPGTTPNINTVPLSPTNPDGQIGAPSASVGGIAGGVIAGVLLLVIAIIATAIVSWKLTLYCVNKRNRYSQVSIRMEDDTSRANLFEEEGEPLFKIDEESEDVGPLKVETHT